MAAPGLTQVIEALALAFASLAGQTFVDRDDSEPIQPSERPARVIRVVDVVLDESPERGRSAQAHLATIDVDFYCDADVTDNISFQHNIMIAEAIAAIGADWTLGGKVYTLTPMSVTAAADVVPAAGVAVLTLDVRFLTALFDWTEIIF